MFWPEITHALAHDSILEICNKLLIEAFCPHTCIIKVSSRGLQENLQHMKANAFESLFDL